MTTILLIRHGQSEANLTGVFAGNYDSPLVELGFKQAEKTAEFIAENYKVDKVYASDLIRAFETGKTVANKLGLEVIPEPGMREIRAGKWEGIEFEKIISDFPEEYARWIEGTGDSGCPGGENVRILCERVMNTLTELAEENDGKTIAIATHATPIRVSQTFITYGTVDEMVKVMWVPNASVTEIKYNNGKWELVKVGQDGHLDGFKTNLPANV